MIYLHKAIPKAITFVFVRSFINLHYIHRNTEEWVTKSIL